MGNNKADGIHVFLTSLSTLPKGLGPKNISRFEWAPKEDGIEGGYYYLQQIPGFRITRDFCLKEGTNVDRIVVICSEAVRNKDNVSSTDWETLFGESGVKEKSVFDCFKKTLIEDIHYIGEKIEHGNRRCREESIIPFVFGDEKHIEKHISELLRTMGCSDEQTVHLHIDTQGGLRTNNLLIQSLLSIADRGSSKLMIDSIVAGEGKQSDRVYTYRDVTDDYAVLTLVSGMNAFLKYGKADLISEYIEGYVKRGRDTDGNVYALGKKMVLVDRAMSVCDAQGMLDQIKDLYGVLSDSQKYESPFDFIVSEIRREYEKVMDGTCVNVPKLIKWMLDKQFYQQALTLCEASMPEWVFKNKGFLKYDRTDKNRSWDSVWDCDLENYQKKNITKFIFERFAYLVRQDYAGNASEDRYMKNSSRFSIQAIRDRSLILHENANLDCARKSLAPEMEDFLISYNLIKDIRNKTNHASSNLADDISKLTNKISCDDLQKPYLQVEMDEWDPCLKNNSPAKMIERSIRIFMNLYDILHDRYGKREQ